MNSATAFRFLILVIPAVWAVFRLLPSEHQRYGNLMAYKYEFDLTLDPHHQKNGK